ncbi:hypothetical protein GBAR_LOCUS31032 [Geodia barretti]|uniref:Uncharacterized protein n=1 Tax=Geodia barretti TaxID=519541 RepID=A0AA35XLM9_GEOBA|nr:hypothetical protein GBAR_LOCUS31032 [Geodia barretti]
MPAGPEAALPGRVLRPSLLHRLSAEGPERQRLLSDVQGARTPRVHGPEHSTAFSPGSVSTACTGRVAKEREGASGLGS